MNIQVNGENRKIQADETLASLVKKLHPCKQRIAAPDRKRHIYPDRFIWDFFG